MKKGFKIFHNTIFFKEGVLIVSNYNDINKIYHYNLMSKEDSVVNKNDIGMWKIKKLKHE